MLKSVWMRRVANTGGGKMSVITGLFTTPGHFLVSRDGEITVLDAAVRLFCGHFWVYFGRFLLCVTQVMTRYHRLLRRSRLIQVRGMLERNGNVHNVIAEQIAQLK